MKKTLTLKTIIPLLLFITIFTFSSCNADKEQGTLNLDITYPELIERNDKIQYGKEWDDVQNNYAEQINTLRKDPLNHMSRIKLAQLYIKEARVTGEHGHYYPAALEILKPTIEDTKAESSIKFLALMTKAGVQLSLHEFAEAKETGNLAVLLNPANAQIHGVLVDANVELGDYDRAVALSDRMVNIKPDIRSYSRISYLREIHGDVEGSIKAMEMAIKAGYPGTEETAWAMQTLGDFYMKYNDLDKAEKVYNSILTMRVDYPFAVGALGEVYMKKGDLQKAEQTLNQAIDIIPEVGFYISLATLYKQQNRTQELKDIMPEIFAMLADDEASGHNMNLEYAYIYLDIMEDYGKAMEYAEKEYNKRPNNIDVNLVMAKIEVAKQNTEAAKKYIAVASKTNSKNPELLAMN